MFPPKKRQRVPKAEEAKVAGVLLTLQPRGWETSGQTFLSWLIIEPSQPKNSED